MKYSERLKDPRWQQKRLEVLSFDEWRCVLCGRGDKTLHVHHVKYIEKLDPWDYPLGLLVTLCENHHRIIHNESLSESVTLMWKSLPSQLNLNPLQMLELMKTIASHETEWGQLIKERGTRWLKAQKKAA